jgi:hypothetical protein
VSPIVAALDQPEASLDREAVPRVALSLVEAFAEIPDPRHARGIRHGVLAIVLLGACAVLTGARSFAAIAEYAHDTGRAILDLLGVGTVVPHACTIRRVLQDLDPDAVEAAMRTWALAQLADRPAPDGVPVREQRQVLALDGKTVRGAHIATSTATSTATSAATSTDTDAGSGGGGYRQPHLVSVLDLASGVVLGQVTVAEKSSEIAAFTTLLDDLDLTDVLITADAVHTNRHHADYLHQRGGHYCQAPGSMEAELSPADALPVGPVGVVERLVLRGWDEPELAVQAPVVVPVDVLGHGDLEVFDTPPRAFVPHEFGLEQRVERLGHRVVVGVTH